VTLINSRQNEITAAKTRLAVANNTANIKIIQAEQQALSIINAASTQVAVVDAFFENRGLGYLSVMRDLKFNSSQLVSYIKSETIRQTQSKLVAHMN
jgi:hypothetical protein